MSQNVINRDNYIINYLNSIEDGSSILDAGAGLMPYKKFCSHLNYVSQDFAQYSGDGEEPLHVKEFQNIKVDIVSDIISIPLASNSFDYILCTEVFEHIPDPLTA